MFGKIIQMSRTESKLSQYIGEAHLSLMDSNESLFEDKVEDSSSILKDALLAKCRETIEV